MTVEYATASRYGDGVVAKFLVERPEQFLKLDGRFAATRQGAIIGILDAVLKDAGKDLIRLNPSFIFAYSVSAAATVTRFREVAYASPCMYSWGFWTPSRMAPSIFSGNMEMRVAPSVVP